MLIWLLSDGETLPGQAEGRKMRSWMLAEALVERGHEVVWWASTFSHHRKKLLFDQDTEVKLTDGFQLKLLHCGSYKTNVSVRRYLHHRALGQKFKQTVGILPKPDVIVSAFPKIELAYHAISYSRRNKIPLIVDVRDLWPDTYLDKLPYGTRRAGRVIFHSDFLKTKHIFFNADSLVSMSEGVLNWALRFSSRPRRSEDCVFYIGHPDDPAAFKEHSFPRPEYLSHVTDKIIFAYVGAFGGSYELKTICRVAEMLGEKGIDQAHFVLGGEGAQFATISKMTSHLKNVSLPGWLDQAQIKSLLSHAHVAILPWHSIEDAMPNKLYEYLAASLPILSSLTGEMERIIDEWKVGYSYNSQDADGLYSLVVNLINNQDIIQAMSENACALFKAKFSCQDIYTAYARHVEEIAARSVGNGA